MIMKQRMFFLGLSAFVTVLFAMAVFIAIPEAPTEFGRECMELSSILLGVLALLLLAFGVFSSPSDSVQIEW